MKKPTKRQLEKVEQERAALEVRMLDLLFGALHGSDLQDDGEGDFMPLASGGAEEWSGWMRTCQNRLSIDEEYARPYYAVPGWTEDRLRAAPFQLHWMAKFELMSTAVDHLYEHGFRA